MTDFTWNFPGDKQADKQCYKWLNQVAGNKHQHVVEPGVINQADGFVAIKQGNGKSKRNEYSSANISQSAKPASTYTYKSPETNNKLINTYASSTTNTYFLSNISKVAF